MCLELRRDLRKVDEELMRMERELEEKLRLERELEENLRRTQRRLDELDERLEEIRR